MIASPAVEVEGDGTQGTGEGGPWKEADKRVKGVAQWAQRTVTPRMYEDVDEEYNG